MAAYPARSRLFAFLRKEKIGKAWPGVARQGVARRGMAWHGKARPGAAWRGEARRGEAGLGVVPIKHLREGLDRNCPNGHLAWRGEARRGWAWLGEARLGKAVRGKKYDDQRSINNNRGYFASINA